MLIFSMSSFIRFKQRKKVDFPHPDGPIVEESLKQAAIWEETKDNLNRNAQAFSGGQQQRICIELPLKY